MSRRNQNTPFKQVRRAFDRSILKRVCEADEISFADDYALEVHDVPRRGYDNYYLHGERGSDILFVAHLDTVVEPKQRMCAFADTAAGPVVHSGALDDRLGAYIGLELLPALGIQHDILLSVGEESGRSTAEFFETDKRYNWVIEFDRGGTDVVMYQFEDLETRELVEKSGASVGEGILSDITYMDGLGVKAFNWGVGYRDYHGLRSHAYLNDTFRMVGHYLRFHEANHDVRLPHEGWSYGRRDFWWDEYEDKLRAEEERYVREHAAWLEDHSHLGESEGRS